MSEIRIAQKAEPIILCETSNQSDEDFPNPTSSTYTLPDAQDVENPGSWSYLFIHAEVEVPNSIGFVM